MHDWLAIVLFLLAIGGPLVDEQVRSDEARGPRGKEQRVAASKPGAPRDLAAFGTWPERYSSWYDDRFGLRDWLIHNNSLLKIYLFGVSPSREVHLGKEQWIFYAAQRSVEVLRGLAPFAPAELEAWRRALESHRDWCAVRGVEYLFVIGPNKESIYHEFVPDRFNRVGPTRLDQLVAHLALHSSDALLDVRPALRADKANDGPETYFNYYPLGSHWCQRGRFVAYRAILERLQPHLPGLGSPLEPSDFEVSLEPGPGDSFRRLLYLPDRLAQKALAFEPKVPFTAVATEKTERGVRRRWTRKDDPRLPRAVVFHDSFGLGLETWLPEHFSYSASIRGYEFDTRVIEAERPDLVLEIFVERKLAVGPPPIVDARAPAAR